MPPEARDAASLLDMLRAAEDARLDVVWRTVQQDLPALLEALRAALGQR